MRDRVRHARALSVVGARPGPFRVSSIVLLRFAIRLSFEDTQNKSVVLSPCAISANLMVISLSKFV